MTSSLRTKAPARRGVVVVFAVCLPCLMFGLEISSIPAILPTLEHLLHASFEQLQWVMNAYTIAVTTVLMAAGTLADRYGRKRVFLISIVGFGLASLTGVAQNVATLIVARFLQGLCGGAMLIAQIAVLSHAFQEGRERAVAWGWWGVASGIGLGFGPIVGGAIVAVSNWGWVFLIHVLFAALALVLAASGVDESNDPQAGSIDIVGISALSLSSVSFGTSRRGRTSVSAARSGLRSSAPPLRASSASFLPRRQVDDRFSTSRSFASARFRARSSVLRR